MNKIIYVDFSAKPKKITMKKKIKDFFTSLIKNKNKISSEVKGKLMIYDDFRHIL